MTDIDADRHRIDDAAIDLASLRSGMFHLMVVSKNPIVELIARRLCLAMRAAQNDLNTMRDALRRQERMEALATCPRCSSTICPPETETP